MLHCQYENVLEGTQEGERPVELCRKCLSTQKKREMHEYFHNGGLQKEI
jgi:hypothetical protein